MQLLQRQQDLRRVEQHARLGEGALAPQVEEELAAAHERQHQVQLVRRLEGKLQADDERVPHRLQHVPLGQRVLNLVAREHVLLAHDLHGVQPAGVPLPRLHDLAVRAAPKHAHQVKIVLTDRDRGYRGQGVRGGLGGGLGRVHVAAIRVVLIARRGADTTAAHPRS